MEGSIRTRKWQDKEGQDRYTTEVRGDRMQMLGSRPAGDGGQRTAAPAASPTPAAAPAGGGGNFNDFEDDIPF